MDKEEVMRLKALHQKTSLKLFRKFQKLDKKQQELKEPSLALKTNDWFYIYSGGVGIEVLEFNIRKLDLENDEEYK